MIGFPDPAAISAATTERWPRRRESPVFGRRGMVASAHPLATAAGLRVLSQGGNAVDAAVAAALTTSVVLPAMCGVGGDLFSVVWSPGDGCGPGELLAFHGSGIAPRGTTIDFMREHGADGGTKMPQQGPLSVAVPGMIAGCFTLLERFGTRTFADVAGDAIEHADRGFPISRAVVRWISENQKLLSRYPISPARSGRSRPAAGTSSTVAISPGGSAPSWRRTAACSRPTTSPITPPRSRRH